MNKCFLVLVLVLFVPFVYGLPTSYRVDDFSLCKQDLVPIMRLVTQTLQHNWMTSENITVNIAVIAKNMQDCNGPDPGVLEYLRENSNVVKVVAHGYNHVNPCGGKYVGEFYEPSCPVAFSVQEEHFQSMTTIFKNSGFTDALKILYLPGSRYDNNTILLAQKYGYTVMTGYPSPIPRVGRQMYGTLALDSFMEDVTSIGNLDTVKNDMSYLKTLQYPRYCVAHVSDLSSQKYIEAIFKACR